jgi:hypothetical protein
MTNFVLDFCILSWHKLFEISSLQREILFERLNDPLQKDAQNGLALTFAVFMSCWLKNPLYPVYVYDCVFVDRYQAIFDSCASS